MKRSPKTKRDRLQLAVFPDNFAKYRVHAFRAIGSIPGVALTVYSTIKGPRRGAVDIAESGVDYFADDSFSVLENRNYLFNVHILWTTCLVEAVMGKQHDVVVAWGEVQNLSVWLALLWGRLLGRSVLLWGHGMYGNEGYCKRHMRVMQCRLAEAVFLYGDKARVLLHDCGIPQEKLHVVYNSLDYSTQKSIRESLSSEDVKNFRNSIASNASDDTRILLFVGSLTARKRLDVGLHCLALLRKWGYDYRLVVVGSGEKLAASRQLANTLDIVPYVMFKRPTYSEQTLAHYFMAADLVICPGALGLLAVHAHAYGRPVCTHDGSKTRHGPEHEIITKGETGCTFREGDVEDLANTVRDWFAGSKRDNDEVTQRCIDKAERFYNPDAQAKIIELALHRLGHLR